MEGVRTSPQDTVRGAWAIVDGVAASSRRCKAACLAGSQRRAIAVVSEGTVRRYSRLARYADVYEVTPSGRKCDVGICEWSPRAAVEC